MWHIPSFLFGTSSASPVFLTTLSSTSVRTNGSGERSPTELPSKCQTTVLMMPPCDTSPVNIHCVHKFPQFLLYQDSNFIDRCPTIGRNLIQCIYICISVTVCIFLVQFYCLLLVTSLFTHMLFMYISVCVHMSVHLSVCVSVCLSLCVADSNRWSED